MGMMRRLSALWLLLALVSASVLCAATTLTPIPPAHPCCPHSNLPNSGRCANIGCIGTSPVLVPNSVGTPIPGFAVSYAHTAAEAPAEEWILEPVLPHPSEIALFLTHHQLVI